MVSVCAGCDAYYPWVAAILGCIAGVVYLICSLILVKLKIQHIRLSFVFIAFDPKGYVLSKSILRVFFVHVFS